MLGNFEYSNPTKLYFWEDSLCSLNVGKFHVDPLAAAEKPA